MTLESDPETHELDDVEDRVELRHRYYGLLQEMRVLLPGVQILVAFLLTAPFASRFGELDDLERGAYGTSLVAGIVAVVAFAAPIAMHRVGDRSSRVERVMWGVRLQVVGLGLTAVSLLSALLVVWSVVFGSGSAMVVVVAVLVALALCWVVIPLRTRARSHRPGPGS